MTKGVNFTVLEGLSSLLLIDSPLDEGEFLSFFLLFNSSLVFFLCNPSCLIATKASSAFMYFCAFNSISAIDPGGLFASATTKSFDFKPGLKVVNYTLSSALSTSSTSLLNLFTQDLSDSPSPHLIMRRWSAGLFWHYP